MPMESTEKKILDLGCGKNKHYLDGAKVIGVDIDTESDADVIYDLNVIPWPFKDDEFDMVICQDVLEHLDDLPKVMLEVRRVCKNGGIIKIRTPHYSSYYSYNDPTHKQHLGYYAFDKFCQSGLRVVEKRIQFPRIWRLLGLSALFNKYPHRWEQLFAFMFRAENLYIEIWVEK